MPDIRSARSTLSRRFPPECRRRDLPGDGLIASFSGDRYKSGLSALIGPLAGPNRSVDNPPATGGPEAKSARSCGLVPDVENKLRQRRRGKPASGKPASGKAAKPTATIADRAALAFPCRCGSHPPPMSPAGRTPQARLGPAYRIAIPRSSRATCCGSVEEGGKAMAGADGARRTPRTVALQRRQRDDRGDPASSARSRGNG